MVREANADDPAAHDLLGAWYCLVQDDWATGLGHLARSGHSQLRALARAELAQTADGGAPARANTPAAASPDALARGDAWWDAAAERAGDSRLVALRRAGYWYRRADAGALGALRKLQIAKRLESIAEVEPALAARRAALRPPPAPSFGAAWREGW